MRSLGSVACCALLLTGCGGGRAGLQPPASAFAMRYGAYDMSGLASWYGEELAGNLTASGERFDPNGITVAHRTLPLGSIVEVTARDTGRSILARVTDRGPGRKDREIDLSRGAARLLGTDRLSVAAVRVRDVTASVSTELGLRAGRAMVSHQGRSLADQAGIRHRTTRQLPPASASKDRRYAIQVASYSSAARAQTVASLLDGTVVPAGGVWRVRLGPFQGVDAVQRARDAVASRGYADAQILPVN